VGTWHDPDLGRPIAASLERCAELLGVDLATVRELATNVEPYIRMDGTKVWSLMQLSGSSGRRRTARAGVATSTVDGHPLLMRSPWEPADCATVLNDSAGLSASALIGALTPLVGIVEPPRSTTRLVARWVTDRQNRSRRPVAGVSHHKGRRVDGGRYPRRDHLTNRANCRDDGAAGWPGSSGASSGSWWARRRVVLARSSRGR
jgi:hypothetical protein